MPDFINLENVSFSYPTAPPATPPALSHISLSIQEGESIALIGANGSGKSTLAKLLNALLLPDSGKVFILGLDTQDHSKHVEIRTLVGMVFQRPQDQIVATTVEEEAAFGPGNLGMEPRIIRARVDEALNITGLIDFQKRPSYLLSAGETQRLALAGVLAMQPRCIIFDETTAMLDPAGREMVMGQINAFHHQGLTTILITHLMEEAAQADRIIVLNQGRLMLDDTPGRIFTLKNSLDEFGLDQPPAAKAGESLRSYFPGIPADILTAEKLLQSLPLYSGRMTASIPQSHIDKNGKRIYIQISDLSYTYLKDSPLAHQALDHLTMQVSKGCIHSLIGRTGSGKSTILQHINGLIRPQEGSVRVADFNLADAELDIKALRRKTALAFQQPEDQFFEQYVGDEIAYAPRHLGYSGKLKDVVQRAMQAVGLEFESYKDRLTSTLSGGEKRKVALASILAVEADILLLDEPLSGLDPYTCHEVIKLFQDLNQKGKTILVSTHQYEELIPILDNVSVINNGNDALQGHPSQVFSQTQKLERVGLKAPLAAEIAQQLENNGWPLDPQTASLPAIKKQLAAINASGDA